MDDSGLQGLGRFTVFL